MAHHGSGSDPTTICLQAPVDRKAPGRAAGVHTGEPVFRTPVVFNPVQLRQMPKDEEERLRQDFRRLEIEARNEFKSVRAGMLRRYGDQLAAAKQQYLEEVVASREKLLASRQQAREEYEKTLRNAQNNYEFTVDIVREQYRAICKEAMRIVRMNGRRKELVIALAE